jgi:iron complex transport system substrate-binding protein
VRRRAIGLFLGLVLGACRPEATPADRTDARRILTLAPNLAEFVFVLGQGDRVVGVSDYTAWPPEASALPRVGGLFNPNFEAMVALQPDLALLLPSEADIGERLRRVGVETLTLEVESLADVASTFRTVGTRLGDTSGGERQAAAFEAALAPRDLHDRGATPRVLIVVGREPGRLGKLYVAGPGTVYDEMLTRLGARNVFADAQPRYPEVGFEEILSRRPEVVLELRADALSAAQEAELLADWQAFPSLPAVAAGRVQVIAADYALMPGPRLGQLYDRLAEILAP